MAMGEYFRDAGRHALSIYDDLSRHAQAYRAMSYCFGVHRVAKPTLAMSLLHARLLERAAKLRTELGGGSLTALPIIETQAGDLAGNCPALLLALASGQPLDPAIGRCWARWSSNS